MATKEDILEQLVEEYLLHKGYFVRHNIKFLPRRDHPDYIKIQDSNHSDIDILGYNPNLEGPSRVMAVSCKSWQHGFNPESELRHIREERVIRGRDAWKSFRELTKQKWSEAFISIIQRETNSAQFTYVLAVARLKGDRKVWENTPEFIHAINGNPIIIVTFREMVSEILPKIGTTLASTEIGRMLQMFNASDLSIKT
ncbi:MAG: hypothetical protein ISS63_05850 [Desulfobacteraceae bacterium]|nr:hypothetical protein [Desulfobacteraceae bacterium]